MMHLPPTRWLVSPVSTQRVQHILGSRQVGPIRLMCWALHMHHSLVGHTQFVFKMHHLLKAITKHVLLSKLYSKKYWKSYCFFPERHQSNLESDQNTIQYPPDTVPAKLGSSSKNATIYQLMQWHPRDEEIPECKVLTGATFSTLPSIFSHT